MSTWPNKDLSRIRAGILSGNLLQSFLYDKDPPQPGGRRYVAWAPQTNCLKLQPLLLSSEFDKIGRRLRFSSSPCSLIWKSTSSILTSTPTSSKERAVFVTTPYRSTSTTRFLYRPTPTSKIVGLKSPADCCATRTSKSGRSLSCWVIRPSRCSVARSIVGRVCGRRSFADERASKTGLRAKELPLRGALTCATRIR